MASTVKDNQALQGRHLSASFGLADDLSVAARSSSYQNGWAAARGLNNAFASVVADLDKMSVATGSLQTLADKHETELGLSATGDLSWGSTNYINDSNNMKQGILSLDSYINNGFVTRVGLVSGSNGSFGANAFAQPTNAKFAAGATYKAAIEALHTDHIDVSGAVANILDSADINLDQFTEVVSAYTAMSSSLNLDLADLQSVIGVGDDANLGTFTGAVIADNQTVKQALQALETDLDAAQTALGISAEAAHLGAFTGGVIADNQTVKAAIQALETDLDAAQTALGVAAEAEHLGTFTGAVIADNQTVKAAIQALETDLDAAQTALGISAEAVHLGAFDGGTVITDNVTVKVALGELDAHASNTRSDFRAALASGVANAVGAEYVIGFAAGAPQIKLVERADGEVDVYFEIR